MELNLRIIIYSYDNCFENPIHFAVSHVAQTSSFLVCTGQFARLKFNFSISGSGSLTDPTVESVVTWYKDDAGIARMDRGVFKVIDQRNHFVNNEKHSLNYSISNNTAELIIGPLIKEFDEGSYKAMVEFPQCLNLNPIESNSIQLTGLEPTASE